jgi:hypothetical protein
MFFARADDRTTIRDGQMKVADSGSFVENPRSRDLSDWFP